MVLIIYIIENLRGFMSERRKGKSNGELMLAAALKTGILKVKEPPHEPFIIAYSMHGEKYTITIEKTPED